MRARTTTSICRASATTAPIRRAWRPARARPSTSAKKTASWSSTRSAARATATASRPVRTRRSTSTRSLGKSREVHLLLSAPGEGRGQRLRRAVSRTVALRRPARRPGIARAQAGSGPQDCPAAASRRKARSPTSSTCRRSIRRSETTTAKASWKIRECPLDYLIYLFGPEVKDVITRLESELRKAQEGGRSEALQLLIGRDAETRYRIRPQLVQIQV